MSCEWCITGGGVNNIVLGAAVFEWLCLLSECGCVLTDNAAESSVQYSAGGVILMLRGVGWCASM